MPSSSLIPDSPLANKPFWSVFSIRDAIYAIVVAYMLINQHFNNEQRLEKLENSNVQIADTLAHMSVKIDTELLPRKENDAAVVALNVRLSNIEAGNNNVMTYLLNHSR